ncbi:substrate-binding periplasmic protein [Bdellovibrio svalbardensis]|uniref:Transporter substrate-binding domain-containing protein n=1 Tax=Bdellovibrio svalbardensis TaxID=2972972 RepID=A0ABT6DH39_9BACT|nr:transporter substrate-binding domain-containing protein [Bdellovibrio svalbardensis]MDG0815792.1 transporter substrate-binding domain-containing protein [Bdellovibrio svalbardensis]
MFKVCSTAILTFLIGMSAKAAPIKTAIGENMSPPWYFADKKNEDGIIPDYLHAIEKKLNQKIEILILPKFRIREYYEKDLIDFNCYTTPTWAGTSSEKFQWSHALFVVNNMIVSNTGPVKSLKAIEGARVGTVLRYNYPTVQSKFDSKELIRDDATNEEANLLKLESDRYQYALVDNHHLAYYLRNHPKSKINRAGFVVEEIAVRCWVRKGSELKLKDLNKAIDQIKSDGTLDKIFQKYR